MYLQQIKDAIIGLSKFFKDNLFDKEVLVQEQNQYQAKMKNPEAIVGSFYAWATAGSVDSANASQEEIKLNISLGLDISNLVKEK